MKGGPSGGTIATVLSLFDNPNSNKVLPTYYLNPNGAGSGRDSDQVFFTCQMM